MPALQAPVASCSGRQSSACGRKSNRARLVPARASKFGPEPPPEWLKTLQAAAEEDEDVAELLRDAPDDPAAVEARIRERFSERRDSVMSTPTGSEAPMRVTFREVDPFDLWVWARIPANVSSEDKELLGEVLKAWFILGKLGGFNSLKLHVQRHADAGPTSVSNMAYTDDESEGDAALFHAMGDCEFKDNWMRCWFDLGTSDELALDVLINSLRTFSKENIPVLELIIGGVNADWRQGVRDMRRLADDEE